MSERNEVLTQRALVVTLPPMQGPAGQIEVRSYIFPEDTEVAIEKNGFVRVGSSYFGPGSISSIVKVSELLAPPQTARGVAQLPGLISNAFPDEQPEGITLRIPA